MRRVKGKMRSVIREVGGNRIRKRRRNVLREGETGKTMSVLKRMGRSVFKGV